MKKISTTAPSVTAANIHDRYRYAETADIPQSTSRPKDQAE
jgi:hypothetical protein